MSKSNDDVKNKKKKTLVDKLRSKTSKGEIIDLNPRLNIVVEQGQASGSTNIAADLAAQYVERMSNEAQYNKLITPTVRRGLAQKASKAEIMFKIIEQVYLRGALEWETGEQKISQQEYGFNRVNSFINHGRSYNELDTDLHEQLIIENPMQTAYNHHYEMLLKRARQQTKAVAKGKPTKPAEGLRVKIYNKDSDHKGQTGYIGKVSPSGHFAHVKTAKGKNLGIHHVTDLRYRKPIKEEHGAGDDGTTKLVKRYMKDTPGQGEDTSDDRSIQLAKKVVGKKTC